MAVHESEDEAAAEPAEFLCPGALIAGTVALMTSWAAPESPQAVDALSAVERGLIARKIVSNLFFLQKHPALGWAMQQVMAQAHARWVVLANAQSQSPEALEPAQPVEPAAATAASHLWMH